MTEMGYPVRSSTDSRGMLRKAANKPAVLS